LKRAAILGVFLVLLSMNWLASADMAQAIDLRTELAALVRSELAFAETAGAKGTKEAFLTFLAEHSIVFRPGPVDGRKFYSEGPASSGTLSWYPTFADISRTGDLGYTTGPYEFRSEKPGDPVRHGNYVSLWRKQADGAWKVVLDTGITNPAPTNRAPEWQSSAYEPAPGSAGQLTRSSLLGVESKFSRFSRTQGLVAAYAANLADDSRFMRPGAQPVAGRSRIISALAGRKETWAWQPIRAEQGKGADLGYTYGTIKVAGDGKIEYYYYTRIWKKDSNGAWRLVLDIANPGPPPAAPRQRRSE
jgi:ketosteroid isomerase-like protein